jgi:hypothetical protein
MTQNTYIYHFLRGFGRIVKHRIATIVQMLQFAAGQKDFDHFDVTLFGGELEKL